MIYSSRNGCLYYYDRVLYSWRIADPTLLFILGLEAITSYNKSQSDNITIYKNVLYQNTGKIEEMPLIDEFYDTIYSHLSSIGSVEDYGDYLKFNCFGLKLFLNDLTGTSNDRTIPVIFKVCSNKSVLDISKKILRVSYKDRLNRTIFDLQAKIIYNIFLDAGYDINHKEPENLLSFSIPNVDNSNGFTEQIRHRLFKDVVVYNKNILDIHEARLSNSKLFCLLDYKAMYSYALGVLYGCKCLGYSDDIIWRLPPRYWYIGDFNNLVNTAWLTFRFHWTNAIGDSYNDSTIFEKYQDIQQNKIWNFENNTIPALECDEIDCFCVYIEDTDNVERDFIQEPFIYSFSKDICVPQNNPGAYLNISVVGEDINYDWLSIYDKVSDTLPLKGVVSTRDDRLVRYIGNNAVYLYKPYTYIDTTTQLEKSLAPQNCNYFLKNSDVGGNVGWIYYDKDSIDSYVDISHKCSHNRLSVVPRKPLFRDLVKIGVKSQTGGIDKIIFGYKCYVVDNSTYNDTICYDNDSVVLWGFYYKEIMNDNEVPDHFDDVLYLEDGEFDRKYNLL